MRRNRWISLLLLSLAATACRDTTSPIETPSAATPLLDRAGDASVADYIVVLRESEADVRGTADRLTTFGGAKPKAVWESAIKGFVVELTPAAAEALARHPSVAFVERDQPVSIDATQLNPPSWGLDRIDQRFLPLNAAYNYTRTAWNVHAYIIDTGILPTHVEFGTRVTGGVTYIFDGNGTKDCNGHGTHVAGTVGGRSYGVAKLVNLHPVRVLSCGGSGTVAGVINGVNWVRTHAVKPAVANMSLGGGISAALDSAVNNLYFSGVTVVVAGGNNGALACNTSPARAARAITVGATQSNDFRPAWSNYGTCLDIFAPGVGIKSAWIGSNTASNTISGTSMASPHVAGAAALYLSAFPAATPATVTTALLANATVGVVGNAGVGSPNRLLYTGFIP
jgi:subtilisin family serine protease